MSKRPETKEEWIAEYKSQGMPADRAAFAAAVSVGEIDGDVIEFDDLPPEEPDITSFYGTKEDTDALEKELQKEDKATPSEN